MNNKRKSHSTESGNGQAPDSNSPDSHSPDADLTAFALEQLNADEAEAIKVRLRDDPRALKSVDEICTLGRLLRRSTPVDGARPSDALREIVESRLDALEQQKEKVTLREKPTNKWSRKRLLLVSSVVSAVVLLAVSFQQLPDWASTHERTAETNQFERRMAKKDLLVVAGDSSSSTAAGSHGHGMIPTAVRPKTDQLKDTVAAASGFQSKAGRHPPAEQPKAELAGLVEQFNEKIDQQRFGEAEKIAQQVEQLDPESVVVDNMRWKVRFTRRIREQVSLDAWNEQGVFDPMTTMESRRSSSNGTPNSTFKFVVTPDDGRGVTGQIVVDAYAVELHGGHAATAFDIARLSLTQERSTYTQDDGGWFYQPGPHRHDNRPTSEQYDTIHENRFMVVGPETARSTFSIDVDTASYANVRRFLNHNTLPPANAVRIEELVNYFQYDYPNPRGRDPFAVNMEVAKCPWETDHLLLRIGLKGQEIDAGEQPRVSTGRFRVDAIERQAAITQARHADAGRAADRERSSDHRHLRWPGRIATRHDHRGPAR